MQRILKYLFILTVLLPTVSCYAQKNKGKSRHKQVSAKHVTKKKKKVASAQSQASVKKIPVTLNVSGVGNFDSIYTLHGNRKVLSPLVKKAEALQGLDVFLNNCIQQRAFPGCQVFAAKDGEIVYWKNFGYLNYDKNQPVNDSTLYDIASVTKVAATTLAVMKLYEEGKINLQAYLKSYLPFTAGTNKAQLTIADLLLHQAGLKAYIPFYKATVDPVTGSPRTDIYRTYADRIYTLPVAANFYMKKFYLDTIWEEILNSNLDNKGRYVYSDLDFYFLQKVVEAVSGMGIEQYVVEHFYKPLGLKYTMYNPWKYNLIDQCAPTENDDYFRFQLVQGYVHDPGTAMSGGVAGHAGIFSNVRDLAILLQMLNNGGIYKGQRMLKRETLQLFTGFRSAISRRAYGFDKPEKAKGDGGPASDFCSKTTFGHQGFTGTCAWADPETGIIFIFLSNRVYPTANNNLINTLKVRFKAQGYIYEALGYGK